VGLTGTLHTWPCGVKKKNQRGLRSRAKVLQKQKNGWGGGGRGGTAKKRQFGKRIKNAPKCKGRAFSRRVRGSVKGDPEVGKRLLAQI